MTDDTPTTADMRRWFMDARSFDAALAKGSAFDRWLAEHDRQVAERAWDEGYGDDEKSNVPRVNPYRVVDP